MGREKENVFEFLALVNSHVKSAISASRVLAADFIMVVVKNFSFKLGFKLFPGSSILNICW